MRVALFFDGKNFFRSMERYDNSLEVEYEKLAAWVTLQVAGSAGAFVGAYYYTGYSPGRQPRGVAFDRFLTGLDFRRGFFVRREPRVARTRKCHNCNHVVRYKTEKRVDARLVADMIHFAAVNAYDIAVLFSGDQDLLPGVEAAAALGKQVYAATWLRSGLSPALRARCFGEIELSKGVTVFASGRARTGRVAAPSVAATATPAPLSATPIAVIDVRDAVLAEVTAAHLYFSGRGGNLSEWYYCHKWNSPLAIKQKMDALLELTTSGALEAFDYTDRKGRTTRGIRPKPA
jgi:uncharacterized LabA/DUF88 family protein